MESGSTTRRVIIAGGGTAGWMTAAGLSHQLRGLGLEILLVESEQIGTVGVGEATLPHMRFFNQSLGLDERELMAFTRATFKLGIEFCDWGRIGDAYIHPFGDYGEDHEGIAFHHIWQHMQATGQAGRIDSYSLPCMMSEAGKFAFPSSRPDDLLATYSYAYQLDAGRYAQFLRRFSERNGVRRIEGRIVDVAQDPETGFIRELKLESGETVAGDLFIDCTGFRALLIGETMGARFMDWSDVLPCDRAIAVACQSTAPSVAYTRATARKAGWQWRIPLQHRIGNGHVYASAFVSDEEAGDILLGNLESAPNGEPKLLRFKAGQRDRQWIGNCVAVGLSSGFLEPLESTSIYLIQAAITALIEVFPAGTVDARDIAEFNRVMDLEYERVRDFLILHYHATERDDSAFWDYVRTMKIPDSLAYKMELFRERGIVVTYKDGLFLHPSWVAVYLGQRVVPERCDPRVVELGDEVWGKYAALKDEIQTRMTGLQSHQEVIDAYCPSGEEA
ncbi:MAG: tryptophan 7-halogenase [Hyphomonadaceae bacterium]|nr:tryptophan 7-halogenase [Hyphomonadaceae bacterium]